MRLRRKPGPGDVGNEAGQAGEKERLGWSQMLGQSAEVYCMVSIALA